MSQVSLVPILLWLAALACAAVAVWQGPLPIDRSFVIDRLLRYLFLFPLGLLGLWAFIGHVFFAGQSAASIGWAPSPFQYEVGVANLGLGLASLMPPSEASKLASRSPSPPHASSSARGSAISGILSWLAILHPGTRARSW